MNNTNTPDDHLPPYRVRPRFEIETTFAVKELISIIKKALEQEGAPCKARIHDGYATLFIPSEEQHFWSPQLTLSVDEIPNGCSLRGLYGPRPEVWTMFVFFYAVIGFAILIISIFGFSNLSLGNSGNILWLLPVLVLIFLSLYVTAYLGQKMGHDQMIVLHTFVEETIGMKI